MGLHFLQNGDLLVHAGIGDLFLDHETVRLGFGKRVGALLLNGVLGGDDNKNILGHFVGNAADGHLPLLHGFQHGALGLGAGTVDLVQQDKIGEDGTEDRLELAGLLMIDLGSYNITGQQVGGTLYPGELAVHSVRDRLGRGRLGQSGHRFDQDMAVRDDRRCHGDPQRVLSYYFTAVIVRKLADHLLGIFEIFSCYTGSGILKGHAAISSFNVFMRPHTDIL